MQTFLNGASSYVEIDLLAKTNLKTLDLHLRYILDPACCQVKMTEINMEEMIMIVSRPLFETLPILKKKKVNALFKQRKLSQPENIENAFIQARNKSMGHSNNSVMSEKLKARRLSQESSSTYRNKNKSKLLESIIRPASGRPPRQTTTVVFDS